MYLHSPSSVYQPSTSIFTQHLFFFFRFFFFSFFFFSMWTIYKVFIEFVTLLLLFSVLVFWLWGTWDLTPRTEIKPTPPALKEEVPTTGPPRKSLYHISVVVILCKTCFHLIMSRWTPGLQSFLASFCPSMLERSCLVPGTVLSAKPFLGEDWV